MVYFNNQDSTLNKNISSGGLEFSATVLENGDKMVKMFEEKQREEAKDKELMRIKRIETTGGDILQYAIKEIIRVAILSKKDFIVKVYDLGFEDNDKGWREAEKFLEFLREEKCITNFDNVEHKHFKQYATDKFKIRSVNIERLRSLRRRLLEESGRIIRSQKKCKLKNISNIIVVKKNNRNEGKLIINKDYSKPIVLKESTSKHIMALATAIEGNQILESDSKEECKSYLNSNKNCRLYKDPKTSKPLYQITKIVEYNTIFSANKTLQISSTITSNSITHARYKKMLSKQKNNEKRRIVLN